VPYLTPETLPEERDCRALFIPASSDWLAIVSGALTELTKSWNWAQEGAVTVPEAIAAMQDMVDEYYASLCGDCVTPLGHRIIRLGTTGQIQELIDGEWVEPTGDYDLPPTPSREEPTEAERLCAAAANASAVMQLFYENVSDSFNDSLDTAAAIVALSSVVSLALGSTGFGLALSALIEIGQLLFGVFYSIMEFVTADLWTEGFNDTFTCVLLSCASEDAEVVHFDYECVLRQLSNATELTLDLEEVRLFGQIAYLLNFIGAQGLDAAGATTGVEEPECDCACEVSLFDPYGYGIVVNVGGNRWRCTAQFVDTNYALGIADIDGKCFGYTNLVVNYGAASAVGFQNCIPAGEDGMPSACDGDPTTGHGADITSWFFSGDSGFEIEFDAWCFDDCV
jgi:hypothetical protein